MTPVTSVVEQDKNPSAFQVSLLVAVPLSFNIAGFGSAVNIIFSPPESGVPSLLVKVIVSVLLDLAPSGFTQVTPIFIVYELPLFLPSSKLKVYVFSCFNGNFSLVFII